MQHLADISITLIDSSSALLLEDQWAGRATPEAGEGNVPWRICLPA